MTSVRPTRKGPAFKGGPKPKVPPVAPKPPTGSYARDPEQVWRLNDLLRKYGIYAGIVKARYARESFPALQLNLVTASEAEIRSAIEQLRALSSKRIS